MFLKSIIRHCLWKTARVPICGLQNHQPNSVILLDLLESLIYICDRTFFSTSKLICFRLHEWKQIILWIKFHRWFVQNIVNIFWILLLLQTCFLDPFLFYLDYWLGLFILLGVEKFPILVLMIRCNYELYRLLLTFFISNSSVSLLCEGPCKIYEKFLWKGGTRRFYLWEFEHLGIITSTGAINGLQPCPRRWMSQIGLDFHLLTCLWWVGKLERPLVRLRPECWSPCDCISRISGEKCTHVLLTTIRERFLA